MVPFKTIADVAAKWYNRNCVETQSNRGVCVDRIHEQFDPNWIRNKRPEAWCAKFVWVVYEEAARLSGVANPIPRTAGARLMLTMSRDKQLKVDKKPNLGAVFYRKSDSPGASGHVGIVTEIKNDGITTVEGNLDGRVAYYFYDWNAVASPKWDFSFIHAASPSGGNPILASANGLLGLVLVGTAAFWFFQGRKRK
jgi:hypothetical protein